MSLTYFSFQSEHVGDSYERRRFRQRRTQAQDCRRFNIYLVDDDPIFVKICEKHAYNLGVNLTIGDPTVSIEQLSADGFYDAAIFDYDLNDKSGIQLAQNFKQTPVVIVSNSSIDESLPSSVIEFISKSVGVPEIFRSAMAA